MAYNEELANRVRETLMELPNVEEKKMFRGVTFMVNGKMCISVSGEELMCRIHPDIQAKSMELPGVRGMEKAGKIMKGYVYISPENLKRQEDFEYWVKLALDYNAEAKSSKKKA
jgi:TfoX/Sxy family transcriptional regulator of competence genes